MKKILTIALFFSCLSVFSQLVQKSETVIFSFTTKSGKSAVLASGKENNYIVYRYGTDNYVEMEYPSTLDNSSWQIFTYGYYFRGGGKMNAGMDLNYVIFENNGYNYKIYNEYYAEDESIANGILVTTSKGKETNLKGINTSVEGSLLDLRFNDLIKHEQ